MTNDAILAILALPDIPERQLRFLLALATFTRGQHGWRKAGTTLLAAKAGHSPTTAVKARGELVKAGTIEFVRGKGRGLSAYRIRLPAIADHIVGADDETTNDAGDQPTTNNAGDQPTTKNAGDQQGARNAGDQPGTVEHQPAPRRPPTGSDLTTSPNAPASGNANEGSSTYGSQSSGRRRPRLNGSLEGLHDGQGDDDDQSEAEFRLPGHGRCSTCGGSFAVAGGGTITRHRDRRDWSTWCAGSRQPPTEPVPCARCGQTGVALGATTRLCAACRRATAEAAEGSP